MPLPSSKPPTLVLDTAPCKSLQKLVLFILYTILVSYICGSAHCSVHLREARPARVIDCENVIKYNKNKTSFVSPASTMNSLYPTSYENMKAETKTDYIQVSGLGLCYSHLSIFCWFLLRIKTPPGPSSTQHSDSLTYILASTTVFSV